MTNNTIEKQQFAKNNTLSNYSIFAINFILSIRNKVIPVIQYFQVKLTHRKKYTATFLDIRKHDTGIYVRIEFHYLDYGN